MSNRDSLTFSVKKSLVVGTATAALTAGCPGPVVNPAPDTLTNEEDTTSDTSDASDTDESESDTTGDATCC